MYNSLNIDENSSISVLETSVCSFENILSTRDGMVSNPIKSSPNTLARKLTPSDIEAALMHIVENDRKRHKPVFEIIKHGTVSRIANLAADTSRKLKIGLAGITASGKTTILDTSLGILSRYGIKQDVHYTRLNQDNYYKDTSDLVRKHGGKSAFVNATGFNFDIPDALDLDDLVQDISGDFYLPRAYDKNSCAVSLSSTPKLFGRFIIVDGLFCLSPKMRKAFDLGIYIHTSSEKVKRRWYARAKKRDLVGEAADFVFETAMKEAKKHIIPYSVDADIVINGDDSIEDVKSTLNEFIWAIRQN